ncbi:alpha/beta fold hydrolase [Blattabacterium sp. (Nauphoeta cinerea)]|uniref:alpha/beta fold hydrolase n=1 Tax=Blattabacterium sp. (Nauphoeta cinerea) TaxID=1316444 RepID=UPI0003B04BC8|nr:alpha/beta fold hydrolase [Blattabacterium sp. (Nauphoeta cinerea)]AGW85910.1 alpha/beta fold hydrolase [Blattabacterium sp. (Nauphoeta cinerea)]
MTNIYKINFKIKGKGIPIVLLHGFMESLEIWNSIYYNISNKYKVILIDLPGHGKSILTLKKNTIFTMEKVAEIVKETLIKENIQKAIFVGHSMGGYVALAMAEKYPEMFLGLCLLHSTTKSDTLEKKKNRIQSIQLAIYNYPLFISTSIKKLFYYKKLSSLQEDISFVKKIASNTHINSITSFLKGMSIRKDRKFLLKKTKFPKLYIAGLYDLILDIKNIYEETKNGNQVYFLAIPTGHMGHIEEPKKIVKILENFIDFSIKERL